MELEEHKQRLLAAYDNLGRASQETDRQYDLHHRNPLHIDILRAYGTQTRALGRSLLELVKIVPHLNEIRHLRNEREEV